MFNRGNLVRSCWRKKLNGNALDSLGLKRSLKCGGQREVEALEPGEGMNRDRYDIGQDCVCMLQTYVPGPESEYVGRMRRCGIHYVLKLMMRIRRTKMSTAMVTVEPEYKGDMSYSSINKEGGTYHYPSPP